MTEANTVVEADKDVSASADDTTGKDIEQNVDTGAKDDAGKELAGKETGADKTADGEADKDKPTIPDNWRELAANGDEDSLKLLKRYGSLSGVVKALKDKEALIRSGKIKRDMPDPKDEKAVAEWRKEQGIPDDPSGYKLPETVIKKMSDEDKPMIASFTDYAHKKGAPQAVVDIASEWYFDMAEQAATEQAGKDAEFEDDCETALRKDWAHGEYKANLTLAKRFVESIPGVGENWTEFRDPKTGRRLGDIPEFVLDMADRGRQQFGDVTFATPDSERRHTARKEELEKIRNTDFDRYEREGLDKELLKITEKEMARTKR